MKNQEKKDSKPNKERGVNEILSDFRETTPKRGEVSSKREKERQGYIDELAKLVEKNPEQLEDAQEKVFKWLDDKNKFNEEFQDIMRSYLPIFIGALHCNDSTDKNLKDKARKELKARLSGEELEGRSVPKETSTTVRQWLIRILLRVFMAEKESVKLIKLLNELIDEEDTVLTQIVILAEIIRWLDREDANGQEKEMASELFVKKLKSIFRSERTLAAQGLERLGPDVNEPEKAIKELYNRLQKLQIEKESYELDQDECSASKLADWEGLTKEVVERRAIIKAIESVGLSNKVDVSIAVKLLRKEAEQSRNESDENIDVKVAAVLALGKLGTRLKEENGQTNEETFDGLKKILETLTATAVRGDPTVANAAAQGLQRITDEKIAAERLVDYYLDQDKPSDTARVAEACRLADHHHAIDRLAKESGEKRDRARNLIKKIGGNYAISALGVDSKYIWLKDLLDKTLFGSVVIVLGLLILSLTPVPFIEDYSLIWSFYISVIFVAITFFASIVIAFPFEHKIDATRYLASGLLAFLFSFGMLGFISIGIHYSADWLEDPENKKLKFLSIHLYQRESYNGEEELMASFTSPPDTSLTSVSSSTDNNLLRDGFGTPTWVLFLAVLGSAVLTISVIVREVSDQPDFGDREELGERVGKILQHQYYILFSPIGAVFVYQGLEAGLVRNYLTVGLAAFGAGLALNLILQKAVETAGKALYSTRVKTIDEDNLEKQIKKISDKIKALEDERKT